MRQRNGEAASRESSAPTKIQQKDEYAPIATLTLGDESSAHKEPTSAYAAQPERKEDRSDDKAKCLLVTIRECDVCRRTSKGQSFLYSQRGPLCYIYLYLRTLDQTTREKSGILGLARAMQRTQETSQ